MPVFTQDEYADFDARPTLDEAWDRLPVVCRVGGFGVRWLGPLVELGHDQWMGDLSEAAYGYLEGCGWREALSEGGEVLDSDGKLEQPWSTAFGAAARRLASQGEYSGPESDPERWASWLVFELAGIHGYVKARAEEKGWDS